jgi:hypothetical protein
MANTGTGKDIVGQHIDLTERIRKLEVLPQPAIQRAYWRPNQEELDAIACHVLMAGIWNGPDLGSPLMASMGPAAQYLWAMTDQYGFGSISACQDWTRFFQYVGAFPPTRAFSNLNMSETSPAIPGVLGGAPCQRIWWGPNVGGGAFTEVPNPDSWKEFWLAGLPGKGTWHHWDVGEGVDVAAEDENDGGLQVWNKDDPRVFIDPRDVVTPGGLRGSFVTGDPVMGRDNTFGFLTQTDCEGPNTPKYNAYEYPGRPRQYLTGPQPCPKGNEQAAVFYAGNVARASLWLSELDLYMLGPAKPLYITAYNNQVIGAGVDFAVWDRARWPGMEWLIDTIEMVLPYHPAPLSFYNACLPAAMGMQKIDNHNKMLSMRLGYGWYGRVEVQIREQLAVLQGQASAWSTEFRTALAGEVAAWPTAYGGSWPEWYGYVLPDAAGGPGVQVTFEGRLPDGTPVPCLLTTQINGVRRLGIDTTWLTDWQADNIPGEDMPVELTVSFDGAQIPIQYPFVEHE